MGNMEESGVAWEGMCRAKEVLSLLQVLEGGPGGVGGLGVVEGAGR